MRRRSVSFSENVQSCEPPVLDQSSYSDYLNSWYSCREHKYFKKSVRELAELLETNPSLSNSRTKSTIFRGIERHTSAEKVRIREKREISYSIVQSLQDTSTTQMAKMLRTHSDDCLLEAYNRALEDEEHFPVERPSKFLDNSVSKDTAPSLMAPRISPRRQPQYVSRPTIMRSF